MKSEPAVSPQQDASQQQAKTCPNEEILVTRYRETRDETYFRPLYKYYKTRLRNFLTHYLNHGYLHLHSRAIDVEALIDETLTAFHAACLAQEIGSVRAWLFEAIRRRAQEAIRSLKRQKRGGTTVTTNSLASLPDEEQLAAIKAITDGEGTPDILVSGKETKALVHAGLDRLPPGEAEAIRLVYLKGEGCERSARHLGISERTLRRWITTGLARLRDALQGVNLEQV